jgi:lactate dehydrogenase-like 2-hydroxyacid dehydrogenase
MPLTSTAISLLQSSSRPERKRKKWGDAVGQDNIHVVFAEEDALFRLMEMGLRRALTPEGEKTLRYFFGEEFSAPLKELTTMADRLDLPRDIEVTVCQDETILERTLPSADFVVLEASTLDKQRVEACRAKTRLIQQFGRSYGNIDVATARQLNIPVANLARLSSQSSADHITALILALARNLLQAHRAVVGRRDPSAPPVFATDPPRNKFNWAQIRGFKVLSRSTIGFIGLGENSGFVAKRMRDMGMRVLYFKRNRLSAEEENEFSGVSFAPLDELLAQSDFVSLHIPYGKNTEKFAGRDFFAKMKRGAYLINSARGGILDEVALYESLKSGHLRGAALDVYRYEPVPADTPLLDLENVLWTPHISGGEPEYMIIESEAVLTNITNVFHGRPPQGLIPEFVS